MTLVSFAVLYDDGDEEWLDLIQEKHKLLPTGGPGAAAAVARKRHRKAVLASDSEDEGAADSAGDDVGGSNDSDFSGELG